MAALLEFFPLTTQILALHASDVGTGAERAALAGDDDRAHGLIEPQLGKMLPQLLAHFPGQRIQPLRPVQHHFRHRAFDDQIDRHVRPPSCDTSSKRVDGTGARLHLRRRESRRNSMQRPFEGIRIIDITHVLAGPFAAYELGLMGAGVIKVGDPDEPGESRDCGSDNDLNHANMGTGFLTQGSNKRAITLNLKTEQGREILKKLVATADVLVENYRPGAFEALGLGYEDLKQINPKLIYASFSAFGQGGPRRVQTAYDHVIQSTSGIMAMTGTPNANPIKIGAPAIDYATGTMGAYALSAALFQRERTGQGQRVDMAMLDVAMILMASHITAYLRNGRHPKPSGNTTGHATSQAYETKDGMVMVGASNLRQQRRLWTVLERPEMIKRTNDERHADHDREVKVLKD